MKIIAPRDKCRFGVPITEAMVIEVIKLMQLILMDHYDRLPLRGSMRVRAVDLLGCDGAPVAADEMRVGRRKKRFLGHKTRPLADIMGAVED